MPIRFTKPNAKEWTKVLETLNAGLREKNSWKLKEEYPTILSSENYKRSYVAFDEDKVVAHAAYYPFNIDTRLGSFNVAALGQVWTSESYRGKGLATEILKKLNEEMLAAQFALSILWTGEPKLYEKLGYVRAGREVDWIIDPTIGNEIKHYLKKFNLGKPKLLNAKKRRQVLPTISSLHTRHRFHVQRTKECWQAYTQIPETHWWTVEAPHGVVAYAVFGKGADLQNVLHEWGGDPVGVLKIISHVLQTTGHRLFVIAPDDQKEELNTLLHVLKVPVGEGIVGYAKRLNLSEEIFSQLTSTEKTEFFFWGFDSV